MEATSPETIYDLEKSNIISVFRDEFTTKDEFHIDHYIFCLRNHSSKYISKENYSKFNVAMQNLCKLEPKEFLKAMLNDNSVYFLVIFWYSFKRNNKVLRFKKTEALYNLKFPTTLMHYGNMKIIFDNFWDFVFQAFANTNYSTDASAVSNCYELLGIVQTFWNCKLEPLGRKVLQLSKRETELAKEMFRSLCSFLANDPKVQIIWKYKRICQRVVDNSTFAYEKYSLLARHLLHRLETLPSSEFIEELAWLASQTPLFIAYFFYFLDFLKRNQIPPPLALLKYSAGDYLSRKSIFTSFIILAKDGGSFIFSIRDDISFEQHAEAVRLGHIILFKMTGSHQL